MAVQQELHVTDFTPEELDQRVKRTQDAMKTRGLDALVVYDEGGFIGFGSVRYLAGYSHVPPPVPAFMVVPASGEPTLVIHRGMAGTVHNMADVYCPTKNVQSPPGGHMGPDWAAGVADALAASGFTRGLLGVDSLGALRHPVVEGLKAKLPDANLTDARGLVEQVRRFKTEAELANFRTASKISKMGADTFFTLMKEGVPHDLALAEADHVVRINGGEELNVIMGTGNPWCWGIGSRGDLVFREGELVAIELNARYHGYFSQYCRTVALGKVSEDRQRAITAVRAAHDRAVGMLKPGITGKELFTAALEEVRKRGFDYSQVRYGHGLGLTIGEGYDIGDWDETPIQEGAFGVIHPFVINEPGGRGTYNALWGDPFVMRATGPEFVAEG